MVEQQAMLEIELISQAKKGDENAFAELYRRHLNAIHVYIGRRVTGDFEAEDLTQIVFMKAWQALKNYQPATAPFRAWLYRIAHNTVVDYYRTQKETVQWDDMFIVVDSTSAPERILLETERLEAVHNAVETLNPSYRDVIKHRFIYDRDYAETAEALDRNINNVRVLQHRALGALRRTLHQNSLLWIAIITTAMTLLFSATIIQAAESALPGESLHSLRIFVEDVQLAMANDATDILLHADFADRRVADLRRLSQNGQVEGTNETVTQYASHIYTASDILSELPQNTADVTALTAQFDQLLQEQAASLAVLESSTSSTMKTAVWPALEAAVNTREGLAGKNTSSAPRPSTAEEPMQTNTPAARELVPPPTLQPSQDNYSSTEPVAVDDAHEAYTQPEAESQNFVEPSTEIPADAVDSLVPHDDNLAGMGHATALDEEASNQPTMDLPTEPVIEPRTTPDATSDSSRPRNSSTSSQISGEQPSSAHAEQSSAGSWPNSFSSETPSTEAPSVVGPDIAAYIQEGDETSQQEHDNARHATPATADDLAKASVLGDHTADETPPDTLDEKPGVQPQMRDE